MKDFSNSKNSKALNSGGLILENYFLPLTTENAAVWSGVRICSLLKITRCPVQTITEDPEHLSNLENLQSSCVQFGHFISSQTKSVLSVRCWKLRWRNMLRAAPSHVSQPNRCLVGPFVRRRVTTFDFTTRHFDSAPTERAWTSYKCWRRAQVLRFSSPLPISSAFWSTS